MQSMNVIKDSALGRAFEFTEDDLGSNRNGQLSANQIQRLRGKSINLATIIILVLVAIGVLSYLSVGNDPQDTPVFVLTLVAIGVVTLAGTVGWNEYAMRSGSVNKASGPVHMGYGYLNYNPPVDNGQLGSTRRWMLNRRGAYTMFVENQEFRVN